MKVGNDDTGFGWVFIFDIFEVFIFEVFNQYEIDAMVNYGLSF